MKTANKLTARAWDFLCPALDNIKMVPLGKTYLAENIAEEKNHRGFGLREGGWGLTVAESARLFAVKQLAEYLQPGAKLPRVKDYLHYRHSCYIAAAMVLNYRREIKRAFKESGVDVAAVLALDYAELVKTAA